MCVRKVSFGVMRQTSGLIGFTIAFLIAGSAFAQDTRLVPVDGHAVRVQVGGLEQTGKAPVVVFEAGGGGTLNTLGRVPGEVAKFAPVVAYERAGFGGSEPDGQLPTPRHNVERLHRLLAQLELKPPYVLVGHSWGGPLIRMFAALYPDEIAGMVYLDPTDLRTQQQETDYLRATGFSAAAATTYLDRYWRDWANYLATVSPIVRAELQLIETIEQSGAPEFQRMPPVPRVPVTIVLAGKPEPDLWRGRPCEPRVCQEERITFRKRWLERWIANAQPGSIIVDERSGHLVPTDNPALVTAEIRKVLEMVPKQ
jgi:pimeloyl-ACP methyl ester carboxylesterase